jgi:hypothetical protein
MKDDIAEFRQFMDDLGVQVVAAVEHVCGPDDDPYLLFIYRRGHHGRIFELQLEAEHGRYWTHDPMLLLADAVYMTSCLRPFPGYEDWCHEGSYTPEDPENRLMWQRLTEELPRLIEFLGLENYERASDMRLA